MTVLNPLTSIVFTSLALLANAAVTQNDLSGYANIWVLNSSDWQTANPSQKVGCLSHEGRFLGLDDSKSANDDSRKKIEQECGVFTKLTDYPYTISSRAGNCTFNDDRTEKNTDSEYGRSDHAWSCDPKLNAEVYDGLYTINGFKYPLLCWGDIACYYDAKAIPKEGGKAPLWQYRWGSQQRGITPGHVQLQLLWHKIGETPKREGQEQVPGPRIEVKNGLQAPLQGQEAKL